MMPYLIPDWPAPQKIRAYTTLRTGWGTNYPGTYQDRETLKTIIPLPEDPIWIKQTHSTITIEALSENKNHIADATFTTQPNRVCVVATADCLPLLICNLAGTHVAAIHAGWRGLANGIIENVLEKLSQSGDNLLVWLGPAIGPTKFEVGRDVYEAFTRSDPRSASGFISQPHGKWLANLYTLAKIRLSSYGISKIYGGNYCTFTQNELFFSYRRDKSAPGRMASLIWIEGEKL